MTRSGRPRVPSRSAGKESRHTRSGLAEVSRVVRSRTAPSIFDRPAKCDSTVRECYQKTLDAASGIPHHLTARRSRTAARLQCGCTGRAFGNAKRNPFIEVTPEARARVWSATRKLASCLLDETRRLRSGYLSGSPLHGHYGDSRSEEGQLVYSVALSS